MKIIPNVKETFGDTYFLGYTEKKHFDKHTNKRTDETECYVCKLASSKLQAQIDVNIPLSVNVEKIAFNQKVVLENVTIEPYARSSYGTAFAEVLFRCTATNISDAPDFKLSNAKSEK